MSSSVNDGSFYEDAASCGFIQGGLKLESYPRRYVLSLLAAQGALRLLKMQVFGPQVGFSTWV